MSLDNNPSIGDKIKMVRDARNLSQDHIATVINANRGTLSQIELGKKECPPQLLIDIKMAMDVEHLPMTSAEVPEYNKSLRGWYNAISGNDFVEAKELHNQLSVIKLLPHRKELIRFFRCMSAGCKYG